MCGIWPKSVVFEPNSHRFWKICENLVQTPQILVKLHRCRGVNNKHPSAESGIWNLAFKHHRKIWNFTRLRLVKFQIFLWCLSQIPNSTLRRRMFIINTTTSVEFDQNLWCFSQILTDFQNLWEFGSNTTDIGQIPQILSGDFGWRVVLIIKFVHLTVTI